MSLITRNNYEAYFLDYVEENLSPELIAELMLFLENNPALKEELEGFEIHQLKPIELKLDSKESLKKSEGIIIQSNYEDYLINEIEGENSRDLSLELHLFLEKNPAINVEFIKYQKTKLIASSIIFSDKKSLKRKERKVIPIYWWYSSAAAIIIILFLLNGLDNGENKNSMPIADKEEVIQPIQKEDLVKPEEQLIDQKNDVAILNERIKKSIKTNKKIEAPILVNEEKEIPDAFANLPEEKEAIKDTLPLKVMDEEQIIEDIQYADNVIINYEDEEPLVKVNEPTSRFKIIKEIFNQRVKNKILTQKKDENGDVTAYAITLSGVGFSKNRRK